MELTFYHLDVDQKVKPLSKNTFNNDKTCKIF